MNFFFIYRFDESLIEAIDKIKTERLHRTLSLKQIEPLPPEGFNDVISSNEAESSNIFETINSKKSNNTKSNQSGKSSPTGEPNLRKKNQKNCVLS